MTREDISMENSNGCGWVLAVICRKQKKPTHKRDFEGAHLSRYLGIQDTVEIVEVGADG